MLFRSSNYNGTIPNIFVFEVAGINTDKLPAQTSITNNGGNDNLFGAVEYTEPGDYIYSITETGYTTTATDEQKAEFHLNANPVIYAKITVSGPDGDNKVTASDPVY